MAATGAGLSAPAATAAAPAGAARSVAARADAVDGVWRTDGYGTVLRVAGGHLELYQTTSVSCLPGGTGEAAGPADEHGAVRYDLSAGSVVLRPGALPGRAVLHGDGAAGDARLLRVAELPAACLRAAPKGPRAVFDVFWETFRENYPFFAAKGVDWEAVRDRYRPQVTDETTPARLFAVLRAMVEPLYDAHVYVSAPPAGGFAQGRPGTTPPSPDYDAKILSYVADRDLHDPGRKRIQSFANGHISYLDLPGDRGYLRVSAFADYVEDGTYAREAAELDRALDAVLNPERTARLRGLVIDLRVNSGGYDALGLKIAARLADRPYLAYAKRARNDPDHPMRHTAPQPIPVRPAHAPRYTGPVAVLTSGSTMSAGESFTQALMGRPGRTVRIGESTQGVFSDVMDRVLPGLPGVAEPWGFGLPNEEFLDAAGRTYDGAGIPPQVATPVFTAEEFAHRRDSAFDTALAVLGRE
ncbi:S41 family peptidase [Streptomyces sp. B1866]|uniref:S41 family peptidase n=1 Tax=Streptomyces sp. B1866 TaxID=3075431 RepID=UPI00288DC403|nr:S41 family peptidase [Streptomyces sp. B1866]MDT3399962.1 S41 family peptidase [Streptomyces sp. B1866]